MSELSLQRVADLVDGSLVGQDRPIASAVIDSRQVMPGDIFVAVAGEHVDGHDYVDAAARRGAVAALVEKSCAASIPCVRVADSLHALSTLGAANRDCYHGDLIAITGSNGKTTVKNLCEAILKQAGATVATAGNYNNEIGVPLTLSRLDDGTRFAVVEMGATRRGDVAHLCGLARPTVSTVLNAMEAHLEGFGSVDQVADVKAEIFDGLGDAGTAVVNLDQPWSKLWMERATARAAQVITWSLAGPADVFASDIEDLGLEGSRFLLHLRGECRAVELPLPGRHNIANALAAAALCSAAGIELEPLASGLSSAEAVSGRVQAEHLADDLVLIDDSYNANPGSVRAAISLLGATGGRSVLVLGEMLELGPDSEARHREMGAFARERGVSRFIGVGAALSPAVEAFGDNGFWYADRASLEADLDPHLAGAATVLVKGSRGAAMETVVTAIRERGEGTSC